MTTSQAEVKCADCGETLDPARIEAFLCHGCGAYFCEDAPDARWGPHSRFDHVACDICGEPHETGECPSGDAK